MEQVNFGYVDDDGFTIYRQCFSKYIRSRFELKKPKSEWSQMVTKTEAVFDLLVKQAIDNEYDIDFILEIPDSTGTTCFSIASECSEYICNYIIKRGINVKRIEYTMRVPDFKYPSLTIQMMEKGINPQVIRCDGNSPVDDYPSNFKGEEAKRLLSKFPRSVHYSIEDIVCDKSCPEDCTSSYNKFYFKNGPLVEMTDQKRIGSGGFGMVFKEMFHGKPMAMKCTLLGQIENQEKLNESILDMEANISELRIQIASAGSGVIMPVAFVRQQNQEKDENGIWIAENYDIYIYPLYDCNLYELHKNHYDQFTDEILGCILHQCLTRKCSNLKVTKVIFE